MLIPSVKETRDPFMAWHFRLASTTQLPLLVLLLIALISPNCSTTRSLRVLGDGPARGARVEIDGMAVGSLPSKFPPNDSLAAANPFLDLRVAANAREVLVISTNGESLSCQIKLDTHIVMASFSHHDILPSETD